MAPCLGLQLDKEQRSRRVRRDDDGDDDRGPRSRRSRAGCACRHAADDVQVEVARGRRLVADGATRLESQSQDSVTGRAMPNRRRRCGPVEPHFLSRSVHCAGDDDGDDDRGPRLQSHDDDGDDDRGPRLQSHDDDGDDDRGPRLRSHDDDGDDDVPPIMAKAPEPR